MDGMGLVIKGHRSSKRTFGANKNYDVYWIKVGTIEYFIKCMDANMLCAKSVQRNICFHKDLQSVLLCSQHFKTFNLSLSTRNICFNIKMRSDSFQN